MHEGPDFTIEVRAFFVVSAAYSAISSSISALAAID